MCYLLPFTSAFILLSSASSDQKITQSVTFTTPNTTEFNNATTTERTGHDMDWFRLQPKEVVYVISGNRNFGGHDRQLFKWPILDIVRFTGEQFNETAARFAVVWANAYVTMRVVAPLLASAREAEALLENFLKEIPAPFPTALSGLEGSIEYAVNNVFSPGKDIVKVMVLLTHWNMLHADVNEFLKQKCSRVVLFVLIFPWPYQPCENPKVQRMVLHTNKRLNISGLLKNQMAFCGRRIDMLEIFQPYIFDGFESFRSLVTWCDIHYPITTSTTPVPECEWSYSDFGSMVTCLGDVVYVGLGLVIFFSTMFICAIAWVARSFISFMDDYRKDVMERRQERDERKGKPRRDRDPQNEAVSNLSIISSALRRHAQMVATTSVWGFYRPSKTQRLYAARGRSKPSSRYSSKGASRRGSLAVSMGSAGSSSILEDEEDPVKRKGSSESKLSSSESKALFNRNKRRESIQAFAMPVLLSATETSETKEPATKPISLPSARPHKRRESISALAAAMPMLAGLQPEARNSLTMNDVTEEKKKHSGSSRHKRRESIQTLALGSVPLLAGLETERHHSVTGLGQILESHAAKEEEDEETVPIVHLPRRSVRRKSIAAINQHRVL